jgi:hypothetical protein
MARCGAPGCNREYRVCVRSSCREWSGSLSVSKAGLIQMTKLLALEWARYGIRVNALCPGYIGTDMNSEFFGTEAGRRMIDRIPMRRLGSPDDLNGAFLLIACDASAWMTGANLGCGWGASGITSLIRIRVSGLCRTFRQREIPTRNVFNSGSDISQLFA